MINLEYIDENAMLKDVWINSTIPEHVVEEIYFAQESILFMMFKFDSKNVADALIEASNRGVEVNIILDKRSMHYKSNILALTGGTVLNYIFTFMMTRLIYYIMNH